MKPTPVNIINCKIYYFQIYNLLIDMVKKGFGNGGSYLHNYLTCQEYMWFLWDWCFIEARLSKTAFRNLISVFTCSFMKGRLNLHKMLCGTIFQIVNIANRFLRIFPFRTTLVRNWFPGIHAYPSTKSTIRLNNLDFRPCIKI